MPRTSTRRDRWAGSGHSIGQRTQACSWMQEVENARAQVPMDTLQRSKWPRTPAVPLGEDPGEVVPSAKDEPEHA